MSNMIDFEKHFRMNCEENSLTINLSFDMPKGYETANGTFNPTVNTLFINKEMLQSQPEYEQMFYLFHELRHALQYLHPERFDGLISSAELSELGVLKLIDCSVLQDSYIRLRYEVIR